MATPKVYVLCDANCRWESMTKEQILTAIMQAVNEGEVGDIDTGFIQTIKTINGTPLRFFVGTQAEYEALTDDDKQNLFAVITNDTVGDGIKAAIEELQKTVGEHGTLLDKIINGEVEANKATHATYDQYGYKLRGGANMAKSYDSNGVPINEWQTLGTMPKNQSAAFISRIKITITIGYTNIMFGFNETARLEDGKLIYVFNCQGISKAQTSDGAEMFIGAAKVEFYDAEGVLYFRITELVTYLTNSSYGVVDQSTPLTDCSIAVYFN